MATERRGMAVGARSPASSAGFTLIELMIVVAIVGIITAIAYPSYRDHVFKTRRSDAKIALMEAVQAANRYKAENGRYFGFTLGTHYPGTSPKGYYGLNQGALNTADDNVYFWAIPEPDDLQAADSCSMFVLTTTGEQDAHDRRHVTTAGCWDD